MKKLDPEEILGRFRGMQAPNIIHCRTVGNLPTADFITESRIERAVLPGRCATLAYMRTKCEPASRFIILCDLDIKENDIRRISLNERELRDDAFLGIMTQLIGLMWHPGIREFLFGNPERLIVATIDDGMITVHPDQGPTILKFFRKNFSA